MNRLKRLWLWMLFCAAACAASGKTIALWPIERDAARGGFDTRCRINSAHDLYSPKASLLSAVPGPGWTLPSNPDPDVPGAFVRNDGAVGNVNTSEKLSMLRNDYAGAYVVGTNDFTLEGFFKINTLPNQGSFSILAAWITGDTWKRFIFTLRRDATGVRFNCYGAIHTAGNDVYGAYLSEDEVASLTNDWHHFAIVYRHCTPEPVAAVTDLYIDGERELTYSRAGGMTGFSIEPANGILEFGGRTDGWNRAAVQLDYLRLSDVALAPSAFLTAGDDPMSGAPRNATVGYWKLSADENGIDGTSSVGGSPLGDVWQSDHYEDMTLSHLEVSHASAFTGLPANTAMQPAADLSAANTGSLRVMREKSALWHPEMGHDLTVTNSFTVEGWIKPERSHDYDDEVQMIWTTRGEPGVPGWSFELRRIGTKWWGLAVFANDSVQDIHPDRWVVNGLTDWTDWRHVALVYDVAAGNGTWTVYLDGVEAGVSVNDVPPADTVSGFEGDFFVGGRFSYRSFRGYLDYVRVSKTALRPDQFLNAVDGTAATDVLALWPFDVVNGLYLDGHDATGQNHLQSLRAPTGTITTYHASPADDAPVIANPDTSPAFEGDPAVVSGCVDFGDGSVWSQAFLGTRDPAVLAAVNSKTGLTLEGYFKRTAVPGWNWELYFGFYRDPTPTALGSHLNIGVYENRGFTVFENVWAPTSGSTWNPADVMNFSKTRPDTEALNVWRHVAFTRTFTSTSVVWECFIDGVSQGTSREDRLCIDGDTPLHAVQIMFVGGRYTSRNHFKGKVSSIRVSDRVLSPDEFLCAQGVEPENKPAETWDAASAPLTLKHYSVYTAPGGPFTLEFSGSCADGTETVLAETWDETAQTGWKIVRDPDGAVSVYGRLGVYATPFVAGTFGEMPAGNVSAAVIYDLSVGRGVWTLYVNGRVIGTVENFWTPSAAAAGAPWPLTVGDAAMGTLRKVRLSRAALTRDELLFQSGLAVLVR